MKRKWLMSSSFLVGVMAICVPAFAHHGAAAYQDKVLVLKDATITKFVWANPHTILMFDVKDDQGNVSHWAGEAGSPSAIGLLGWTKNSAKPGDIYPAKSGNPVGRLNKIVFADGTTLRDSQLGGERKDQ